MRQVVDFDCKKKKCSGSKDFHTEIVINELFQLGLFLPINSLSYFSKSITKFATSYSLVLFCKNKTMAGLKPFLFVFVLVAAMTAAPLAEAQLGGLGSGITNLLGLIRIQGTVFCSINGSAGANGTATPVFPNALSSTEMWQLRKCGI
ncbi:hypothetical protein MKW98_023615 [Papaver atlanticum]|uniref:Uncharacterized protein n=1 Tax=Papaver atlanticum TaxID=357466 RepID=A0AAD4SZ65_9MAGN|nr:hypothetical protein MKW98_023615 [Papaver atlanticum]